MSELTGDIARVMANVPAQAGNTIQGALQDAAVKSSQKGAKETAARVKRNPIAELFGVRTFRLPEREGVYRNEKTGSLTRRMAYVSMPIGGTGLVFETSVYAAEVVRKAADGAYLEQTYSVSLPRQIMANKEELGAQLCLNLWKQLVLDEYEVWINTVNASAPVGKASSGPRLVKRVKLDADSPQE